MATIIFTQFNSDPLIDENGRSYIQLTALGIDGRIYVLTPSQKWTALSNEVVSVEDRAAAAGIEIVQ